MKKLILHIGRHKTGTSSLQRFLNINRDGLKSFGIYYPISGTAPIAHHYIARYFNRRANERFSEDEREKHTQAFRNLMHEVANRSETVLLSSEGFQNCNPKSLARGIEADFVQIFVYIREQVEYLISAYQQKVHATNYTGSLEEFSEGFLVNYDVFLRRWEEVFGKSNMKVRIYSRTTLKNSDIVSDFCQNIGIPDGSLLLRPEGDQNPSIGGALLELKRRINSFLPAKHTDAKLYRAFSELAANHANFRLRPALSPEKVTALRRTVSASNLRVFERYPDMENGFEVSSAPAKVALVGGTQGDTEAFKMVLDHLAEKAPDVHQKLFALIRATPGMRGLPMFGGCLEILQQSDMMFNYYS